MRRLVGPVASCLVIFCAFAASGCGEGTGAADEPPCDPLDFGPLSDGDLSRAESADERAIEACAGDEPCLTYDAAICSARAFGLAPGLQGISASLALRGENQPHWVLTNTISEERDPGQTVRQGEVMQINAWSGELSVRLEYQQVIDLKPTEL